MNHFRIDCADALEWLGSLPSNACSLIITDPPYDSLEAHRARGTTTRLSKSKKSSSEWFPTVPPSYLGQALAEMYRVAEDQSDAYVFCDPQTLLELAPMAQRAGWMRRNTLVWDKRRIGMGYSYRRRYENVLYLCKGRRRQVRDRGIPDVLDFDACRGPAYYPTEKPVALQRLLCSQSGERGGVVLDPFCGSGSSGEAALREGMGYRGCDVVLAAANRARARLEGVVAEVYGEAG